MGRLESVLPRERRAGTPNSALLRLARVESLPPIRPRRVLPKLSPLHIDEFHLDEGRYLVEAHNLSFSDIKGKVFFETRKRTKALGLFLDNNPQFLFQYRAGMWLVKNLAQKSVEEHKCYNNYMGLNCHPMRVNH